MAEGRAQELAELRVLHRVVLDRLSVRAVVVHVVRRVREPEVRLVRLAHLVDVVGLRRVSADEEVLSELVDFARGRDGNLRRLGNRVRLRLAVRPRLAAQKVVQLVVAKGEKRKVEPRLLQRGEFDLELVLVPLRDFSNLVVGDAQGLFLLRRQVGGDDAGHRLPAELLHGEKARVTLDDDLVLVEDGGIPEAEGGDYVRQLLDRALVDTRVVLVGNDLRDGDVHDLHPVSFHVCSPVRVSGFAGISSGRS